MLAEARRRRTFHGMYANLLQWAAEARKRAASIDPRGNQPGLFR
ncbi:hypothetical protein [Bradyrhizobium sp. LMTR 3]|nr:hypothetical protein [Bradyrhizobium sp. LMTR 3]